MVYSSGQKISLAHFSGRIAAILPDVTVVTQFCCARDVCQRLECPPAGSVLALSPGKTRELVYGLAMGGQTDSQVGSQFHSSPRKS